MAAITTEDTLKSMVNQAQAEVTKLQTHADFADLKARYVGPHGTLTEVIQAMSQLPKKEKPVIGRQVNWAKQELEALFTATLARIDAATMAAKLGPPIDPTLPSAEGGTGSAHPLSQVQRRVAQIFRKVGFTLAEGPEIDTAWHCFDALNTPADHPARAEQDTYYFPATTTIAGTAPDKGQSLLRTHTSTAQIRTMLQETPPIRILAMGRAFRRDTADATHSANFHQIEGLYIDKQVSLVDLKGVLDFFIRELFGAEVKTRLRPSFFPFTEPSFEIDFMTPSIGKLSHRWVEILGCGMVHPEVFRAVGYEAEAWQGYAFGIGIERVAMLLHGIDDIRHLYQNDLRLLQQFA